MAWLAPFWLAEMHREVYVAILKSWIPHGEKGDFARRIGITREYFSYLCALDHPVDDRYPTKRLPSPEIVEKIAAALPAPPEIRRSLIENMTLAHANAAKAHYVTRDFVGQRRAGELLTEIEIAHQQATFGTSPPKVRRSYRVVRDAAANLLPHLSPQIYPASFAQTCLYIHDAQCVLDRADDALRYAKLARLVLENLDMFEPGFNKEQTDFLEINAIRGEAVAYHNLGLDHQVPRLFEAARATSAYRNVPEFWAPLAGRDMLNATVEIPRYSIRKAKTLAQEIEGFCEKTGDEFTLMLVRESWLRWLIQRRKWDQAEQIFRSELERLPRLSHVGYLHRALLLKSGSLLAWKQGDTSGWQQLIRQTLATMQQAGLKHQIRKARQAYGSALDPIFEELSLHPGDTKG